MGVGAKQAGVSYFRKMFKQKGDEAGTGSMRDKAKLAYDMRHSVKAGETYYKRLTIESPAPEPEPVKRKRGRPKKNV